MKQVFYCFSTLFFATVLATPATVNAQHSSADDSSQSSERALVNSITESQFCSEFLRAGNYSTSQLKRVKVQGSGRASIYEDGGMALVRLDIKKNPPSKLQAAIYRDDKVIATCELEYSEAGIAGENTVSAGANHPETFLGGQGKCDVDPKTEGQQSGLMTAARGDILVFSYSGQKKKQVPFYVTQLLTDCQTLYRPGPELGASRGKSPDEAWFKTPTKKLQRAVKAFQKKADSLLKK